MLILTVDLQRVVVASADAGSSLRADVSLAAFSPAAAGSVAGLRQVVERAAVDALRSSCPESTPCSAAVSLVPRVHSRQVMSRVGAGMSGVGSIIAVASGKGGVGKSTVAVNLAFSLARSGARVGIFDADIYGPSLPLMVTPSSLAVVKRPDGFIVPLSIGDVRLMSYGFVSPRNAHGERGGAVLRGPMVSQVVSQLSRWTDWGALDHLIVDMPPGTGDIHITLGQVLPFSAAVIVTTPQALALADVAKGLDMFRAMRVPPTALVLNMAHFDAPDTRTRYYPFGSHATDGTAGGPLSRLAREHSIEHVFTLPIDPHLSAAGDGGLPVVVSAPESDTASIYSDLARSVADAAEATSWRADLSSSSESHPADSAVRSQPLPTDTIALQYTAKIDSKRGGAIVLREFGAAGACEFVLNPFEMRMACRCAGCVDEVSGELRIKPGAVPANVRAIALVPQGNYGVQVTWSDGHATGIYTYQQLRSMPTVPP
jgi:Mrp family chromosome partitioning ATPase/DUF971 family protein